MSTPTIRTTPLPAGVIGNGVKDTRFGISQVDNFADPDCPVVSNQTADNCSLFKPGHNVHWIQLKNAIDEPLYPVEVISAGERSFTVLKSGKELTFYTHRPEQIQALLDCYGAGLIGWVHSRGLFECQKHFLCVTTDASDVLECSQPQSNV